MLVDATNNFLRNFVVQGTTNVNGEPTGGVHGLINNLLYWSMQMMPTKIFMCWDGPNGGYKRRKILSEYKQHRKRFIRTNRSMEYTDNEIEQNKNFQLQMVKRILETIPVIQMEYEYVEADDVISVLCALNKDKQKIIVSSDKDFYQLLDGKTICFDPLKRAYVNLIAVQKKYGIGIPNFPLFRAIVGDKSDNIKGVLGVGPSNIIKLLPFLANQERYTVADVITYASQQIEAKSKLSKSYQKFIDQQDSLMKCYNVTQLVESIITNSQIQTIKTDMCKIPMFEPIALRILASDDLQGIDIEKLIQVMNSLNYLSKSTNNGGVVSE